MKDKTATYTMTEEFHSFIDQALQAQPDLPESSSGATEADQSPELTIKLKEEAEKKEKIIRDKADKQFLSLFGKK